MKQKNDDFELLVRISEQIRMEYIFQDDPWQNSPFAWIRSLPSRQVGTVGEKIVEKWCQYKGLKVSSSPDNEADRIINGLRVEIKFSTLWKEGFYKFQQLRDQNYDVVLCLGISPFEAHLWAIPKTIIIQKWKEKDKSVRTQHGGQRGRDTAWLTVNPKTPPPWLKPYGGSLDLGFQCLQRLIRKQACPNETTSTPS